jgi:hypothetical protein
MTNLGFKNLVFEKHEIVTNGVQAKMKFNNGEWISVVGGIGNCGLYGNGITSFEVMSSVTEKTNNGVKGWLSKKQVDAHMRYLQKKVGNRI